MKQFSSKILNHKTKQDGESFLIKWETKPEDQEPYKKGHRKKIKGDSVGRIGLKD